VGITVSPSATVAAIFNTTNWHGIFGETVSVIGKQRPAFGSEFTASDFDEHNCKRAD